MSAATTVQALQTSTRQMPMSYMADNPAMPNFVAGFPSGHLFPGQYFNVNTGPVRRGDIVPQAQFFLPPGQQIDISSYSPTSHYPPYDQKPSVPQDQRDIANALLQLNASSGTNTPQVSTPTSTSISKLNGFPDEENQADLLQALKQQTSYIHAAGDGGVPVSGSFEGNRPGCRQYEATRYGLQDVKPIFHHSLSMPNISHLDRQPSDAPMSADLNSPISDKIFTSPPSGKQRRPANKGNNVCQICGKSYARPSTLKTHMRTHSGEKPYRCDICGKAFTQAANLTAHLRTHSGEKPFSCPICQKRFSQSSSVTTHLRTHSGERPYRCDYCGKCFADTSTLTKHKRIHSGEKPYRCKICNLGFSQSGNLHRHMKTHNNQQPPPTLGNNCC